MKYGLLSAPEGKQIGTLERLFILKFFVHLYGRNQRFSSRENLGKRVGLSRQECSTAINSLAKNRVIKVDKQEGQLSFGIIWLNREVDFGAIAQAWSNCEHRHLIDQVLADDLEPIAKRKHQLTKTQKLLLIALLEHADSAGVARDLSNAELAKITGLNQRMVKNQLTRLLAYSYIRCYLPGGNNALLFGKYLSTYVVNLKHKAFGSIGYKGPDLIFPATYHLLLGEPGLSVVSSLRHLVMDLGSRVSRSKTEKTKERVLEEFRPIPINIDALNRPVPRKSWEHLQWRLLDLASYIVNRHWQTLNEASFPTAKDFGVYEPLDDAKEAIDPFIEQWYQVQRRRSGRKKTAENKPEDEVYDLFQENFALAATRGAVGLKHSLLRLVPELDPASDGIHIQILPSNDLSEYGRFAVDLTVPHDKIWQLSTVQGSAIGSHSIYRVNRSGIEEINTEGAMSELQATGLITPPLEDPKLPSPPSRKDQA